MMHGQRKAVSVIVLDEVHFSYMLRAKYAFTAKKVKNAIAYSVPFPVHAPTESMRFILIRTGKCFKKNPSM